MADEETLLVVFTAPVEGREDEYNRWYDERHLPDILAVPGVRGGRRYVKDEANSQPGFAHRYVGIYELDAPVETVIADMTERIADGRMPLSDALDMDKSSSTIWRVKR